MATNLPPTKNTGDSVTASEFNAVVQGLPWINVKDYAGVVGDGSNDDTAGILAAISDAKVAAINTDRWGQGLGRVVFFPRGVYKITSQIAITESGSGPGGGVILMGEGKYSSVIAPQLNTSTDAILITVGNGVGVWNMGIYGDTRSRFRDGIHFNGGSWHTVKNVRVTRANRYGVNIEQALFFRMDDVDLDRSGADGLRIDGSSTDLSTDFVGNNVHTDLCLRGGTYVGQSYGVVFNSLVSEHNGGQQWVTGTFYEVGDPATNGGNLYECVVAGTAGATAPTGTGSSISDGGATWSYVEAFNGDHSYGIKVSGTHPNGLAGGAEVLINGPYFEMNAGWDIWAGSDTTYKAHVTVVNPIAFADHHATGYGFAFFDYAEGGGIFGGAVKAKNQAGIVTSNHNRNTPPSFLGVAGLSVDRSSADFDYSVNGVKQGAGSVYNNNVLVLAYDSNVDAQLAGRYHVYNMGAEVFANRVVARAETTGTITIADTDRRIHRFFNALTGNVTVNLPTGRSGLWYKIVRTSASGAFTINVGGIKTMPSATACWCEVTYDEDVAAWVETGFGNL